jgi:hypothetical protein
MRGRASFSQGKGTRTLGPISDIVSISGAIALCIARKRKYHIEARGLHNTRGAMQRGGVEAIRQ